MGSNNNRINKLLREHMVGADDVLDALNLLNRAAVRMGDRGIAGAADVRRIHDELVQVKLLMIEIYKRRKGGSDERDD
jgi:hypothetical protein